MRKLKEGSIVEVTWVDSASYSPWLKKEEALKWAEEECFCYTVGYVLSQNSHSLTLTQARGTSNVGGLWAIPNVCVRKVRVLH